MKKKIIFLNGHMKTGGVEKSLLDILRHFDYDKYDVDLLLLEDGDDYLPEVPEQVNLIHKPLTNTYGSFLSSIRNCLKKRDFACLVIRICLLLSKWTDRPYKVIARILLGKAIYDCAIAFRIGICGDLTAHGIRAKKKFLWWHHGEYNLNAHDANDFNSVCKEMNTVVSVSESCAKFLREKHPEITDKLTVIPNLLDKSAILQKSELFNPYLNDGTAHHLVSVGRLSPEKHVENVILTAEALIREGYSDFKWYIVGDGSERQKLNQLAGEHGVQEHVVFTGSKHNPSPYMKYADVFVHPSYVESQGLVVLEAMTLGVPCVVTRSLGPCEFIEDGVNGVLTEQSSEDLVEKVLRMLENEELCKRIRENTKCPEQFSKEKIMKHIEALIEEV